VQFVRFTVSLTAVKAVEIAFLIDAEVAIMMLCKYDNNALHIQLFCILLKENHIVCRCINKT